jgi:hypothetical protein
MNQLYVSQTPAEREGHVHQEMEACEMIYDVGLKL